MNSSPQPVTPPVQASDMLDNPSVPHSLLGNQIEVETHSLRDRDDPSRCELHWHEPEPFDVPCSRDVDRPRIRQHLMRLALGPVNSKRRRAACKCWRAVFVWRNFGLRELLRRSWGLLRRTLSGADPLLSDDDPENPRQALYEQWIAASEPDQATLKRQRQTRLPRHPLISLVVPTFRTPRPFLLAMLQSVLDQTYANWELCIADGGSGDPALRRLLERFSRRDERVRVRFLDRNRGIAGNTNAAIEMARGEFVGLLDHDDTLAPFALYEIARAVNDHPRADLLYSDEDKIDETGSRRFAPGFKPAWSPDTLRSHNYICHFAVFRRALLRELKGLRTEFDGAQDYDLVLRASERARQIVHIPQILYHWRSHAQSTAQHLGAKPAYRSAGRRAVAEHLKRQGLEGDVSTGHDGMTNEVRLTLSQRPLISVVIPNKDSHPVLQDCLRSLAEATYQNLEILVTENNSVDPATFRYYETAAAGDPRIRVLHWPGPFNYSAMHNWAVHQAHGEVLLLLNNDVKARHRDWIEPMLEHAVRHDVGCVGAKLFYPNGTIQHAGVIIGLGGAAGHGHIGFPGDDPGDRHRLLATQNLSAVTGACLMLRKEMFQAVEGFDERLAVAFNDVDLCMRIRALDKLVVWTPLARLWHHESLTRGYEDTPQKLARFAREERLFREKWADALAAGDPYYNPNLTHDLVDFSPVPRKTHRKEARVAMPPLSFPLRSRAAA